MKEKCLKFYECGKLEFARGLCLSHYQKARRSGEVEKLPSKDWVVEFWKNVDVKNNDECWNWKRNIQKGGYGLTTNKYGRMKAHRMAWILTNGAIHDGLHVLHRCDNRACCNPSHLFLGTNSDNVADRVAKNRNGKVSGLTSRKLTTGDVLEMRNKYNLGSTSYHKLAIEYNVSERTVYLIIKRKSWVNV